jgi:hypothetical protein
MALVICCVFLTERMRRRMSIRLGIFFYFFSARKRALNSLMTSVTLAVSASSRAFLVRISSNRLRCALSTKRYSSSSN